MRYIKIPKSVPLTFVILPEQAQKDGKKHPELSLANFVCTHLIMHQDVTKDNASLVKFAAIRNRLRALTPEAKYAALDDELFDFLSPLARTYPFPHGDLKECCLDLVLAITGALRDKPDDFVELGETVTVTVATG